MGGMNHQPCREYLAYSTQVSRCLSLGHAHVNLANVAFEDVLLTELEGSHGSAEDIVSYLVSAALFTSQAATAIKTLQEAMTEKGYEDLPPLRTLNLSSLGDSFLQEKMLEKHAWKTIQALTEKGGFWSVSMHFQRTVVELEVLTERLASEFLLLSDVVKRGCLNDVLEENQPGNVKKTFAQLFSNWNILLAEFLASSMLSTHVWYLWTGRQTLVKPCLNLRLANQ